MPRNKAERDGGNTGYLTILYTFKRVVLLNIFDKLGDDYVLRARQSAVLDEKAGAPDGGHYAVRT